MHTTEKNNQTGEKKIITTVIVLLFLSFVFLDLSEQKQTDPTGKNGWWAIYFEDPKSQDLSFTIENNGKAKKFHWKETRTSDGAIIKEATISIPTGGKSTIPLSLDTDTKGEKIVLEVSDENGGTKEIYKNFN